MAQDFSALSSATNYLTLLTQISDRDAALALALDPATTSPTNVLTNSVRYSSANKRWEKYNGSAWVELIAAATDAFAMTVTGMRGGTLYGTTTNSGTLNAGVLNSTSGALNGSIGGTTANTGAFTTISASGLATLAGITGSGTLQLTSTAAVHKVGGINFMASNGAATNWLYAGSSNLVVRNQADTTNLAIIDSSGAITAASFSGALNGTVGATTPSTGAFTTLSATGGISGNSLTATGGISGNATTMGVSGTQDMLAVAGQAAGSGPLITSQNYNATAYAPLTITGSSFAWKSNGATTVLSATSTGLSVTGALSATGGLTLPNNLAVNRVGIATPSGWSYIGYDGVNDHMQIASPTNLVIQVGGGYPETARFTSTGRLGIGQNNPQFLIDCLQAANDATIKVKSSNAGAWFTTDNNSDYGGVVIQKGGVDKWVAGMNAADAYVIQRGRAGTQFLSIDTNGAIRHGVGLPSAWSTGWRVFEQHAFGALATDNVNDCAVHLVNNAYGSGATTWNYRSALGSGAGRYAIIGGTHKWYGTSTVGVADGVITFTQLMTLQPTGQISFGTVSPINSGMVTAYAPSGNQAFVAQVANNSYSLFQGFNASTVVTAQITGNGDMQIAGNFIMVNSGNAYAGMIQGSGTTQGYLAFYSSGGVRQGYIGAGTSAGASDSGSIPYVAGTHAFTGNASFSGSVVAAAADSSAGGYGFTGFTDYRIWASANNMNFRIGGAGTTFQVTNNGATVTGSLSVNNGRAYTSPQNTSFSATPSFNASLGNFHTMGAMTGNVTSVTITNAQEGQFLTIRFTQDATGGRTITTGNMGATNAPSISGSPSTTANKASYLNITYNATAARWEGSWLGTV